jgi:hypothetical protein
MDPLQRQGKWTNLIHASSWLAYAALFFTHLLWPSVGFLLVCALLMGPANIVWQSLQTRVVTEKFKDDQGKVYSAVTFYSLVCSVAGVLGFGALLAALPTATGFLVVAGILASCTALDVIQTFVIFPLGRERAPKVSPASSKVPESAGTNVSRILGPRTETDSAASSYNEGVMISRATKGPGQD